jgi:glycosyltransferase involved in cell wall biosynthesis
LICLSQECDHAATKELEKYCSVEVVLHSKDRTLPGLIRGMFQETPYFLSRFHVYEVAERISLRLSDDYDILHLETLQCAFYGLEARKHFRIPTILRLHNVESLVLRRFLHQQSNPFVKLYVSFEAGKVENYERNYCPSFDRVLMISSEDEKLLREIGNVPNAATLPAGIDIDFFSPEPGREVEDSVLWMGAFQWPPNRDSFWWFVKEIVPLIVEQRPGVKIKVIGSHPAPDILAFRHPNVEIIGFVDDVRPSVRQCAVAVVPLRVGGGVRLKLLELFSMQKGIVSTAIGSEGLMVTHENQLLIADTPSEFASATVRLLQDQNLRKNLGGKARKHVTDHFSWSVVMDQYEKLCSSLTGT